MAFMNPEDALSGKMAKAYATINGQVEELFYAKTGEINIEKNKVDVPIIGRTNTPQRSAGWNGTGTLTVYYMTSQFRQLMIEYIKTGRDFWFDLQVVNEDPSAREVGKQTVIVRNCNLDSITLAKFDATSDDMLDEEMPFTFDDADILDSFTARA